MPVDRQPSWDMGGICVRPCRDLAEDFGWILRRDILNFYVRELNLLNYIKKLCNSEALGIFWNFSLGHIT